MIASLLDICDYFWLENICVLSCTEGMMHHLCMHMG